MAALYPRMFARPLNHGRAIRLTIGVWHGVAQRALYVCAEEAKILRAPLPVYLMASAREVEQSRMRPFAVNLWTRLPEQRRPVAVMLLSFVAGVGIAIMH